MSNKIESVEVLSSGCPKCHKLLEITNEVLSQLGLDIKVIYVTEIDRMIAMGIMSTPALAINSRPVLSGRLPSSEEVREIISKYL